MTAEHEYTPLSEIPVMVNRLRQTFVVHPKAMGIPMAKRRELLLKLREFFITEMDTLIKCVYADLKRPHEYARVIIGGCIAGVDTAISNLHNWTSPKEFAKPNFPNPGAFSTSCGVRYEPLGVALIFGTWNFPIPLHFKPLINAITAGCPVLLKLSEVCVNTSRMLKTKIAEWFDDRYICAVYGGVPHATALLETKFDVIFYTGNSTVGKVVYAAAAKHLTPCILGLNGKSPAFVTKNADLKKTAEKLVTRKMMNVGQFCVSPDHVFVDQAVDMDTFKHHLQAAAQKMFTAFPKSSKAVSRIINEHHFKRILRYLKDNHGGEVIVGGDPKHADINDLYIPYSVILNPRKDSLMMQEEIFGPILPILTFSNLDQVIRESSEELGSPLSMYIFSEDQKEVEYIINNTRSGGVCVNDTNVQMANETIPFGGLGNSGMGNYHGIWGFKSFSHERACMKFFSKM